MELWELLRKGGVLIWPLIGCSVLGLAVFLERFVRFFVWRPDRELAERIAEKVLSGRLEEALGLAARSRSVTGKIFVEVLSSDEMSLSTREKLIKSALERELIRLSRYFGLLSLLGNVAPLLGLLGTVFGMIKAFQVVESLGESVTPSALAGGIWEAMITTAVGLSVAIPIMVALSYLEGRLSGIETELEEAAALVLKAFEERRRSEAKAHF